jgi:hypothetical protein
VPEPPRPLQEGILLDQPAEVLLGHEPVVAAVDLTRTGSPRLRRNGVEERRVSREELADDGSLSDARGPGDDE